MDKCISCNFYNKGHIAFCINPSHTLLHNQMYIFHKRRFQFMVKLSSFHQHIQDIKNYHWADCIISSLCHKEHIVGFVYQDNSQFLRNLIYILRILLLHLLISSAIEVLHHSILSMHINYKVPSIFCK